jgi:hypothetical protein
MDVGQFMAGFFFFFVGLTIATIFLFEAFAIWTKGYPTISMITAQMVQAEPQISVLVAFVVGGFLALLVAHFTDVLALWKP